jgi:hypothetical protein
MYSNILHNVCSKRLTFVGWILQVRCANVAIGVVSPAKSDLNITLVFTNMSVQAFTVTSQNITEAPYGSKLLVFSQISSFTFVLTPLDPTGTTSSCYSLVTTTTPAPTGLSTTAKATIGLGIAIGAIALIGIAVFHVFKKRYAKFHAEAYDA